MPLLSTKKNKKSGSSPKRKAKKTDAGADISERTKTTAKVEDSVPVETILNDDDDTICEMKTIRRDVALHVDDDAITLFGWAKEDKEDEEEMADAAHRGDLPKAKGSGGHRDIAPPKSKATPMHKGQDQSAAKNRPASLRRQPKFQPSPNPPNHDGVQDKMNQLTSKLAILEERLANAERYGDKDRAQDLKYGAIPDIKATLKDLSMMLSSNSQQHTHPGQGCSLSRNSSGCSSHGGYSSGNESGSTATTTVTSKELEWKLHRLRKALERAELQGNTPERIQDLKHGSIPTVEAKLERLLVEEKLNDIRQKLVQAEQELNHDRIADLKFGAIPELKSMLRRLDEPLIQDEGDNDTRSSKPWLLSSIGVNKRKLKTFKGYRK